jgi:hypothetical protein
MADAQVPTPTPKRDNETLFVPENEIRPLQPVVEITNAAEDEDGHEDINIPTPESAVEDVSVAEPVPIPVTRGSA